MKEILPGIWSWAVFNEDKGLSFNGWYLHRESEAVVIDPPAPTPEDIEEIHRQGRPSAILLTNKDHLRLSNEFRKTFDAHIWVHEKDKPLMDIPINRTFRHGDTLPGSLKVVTVPDSKSPGESAFYLSGSPGVMFVGDAIIGKPHGSLNLLPAEKFKDVTKARQGLEILLTYDFDTLLLGDGVSILEGGKTALQSFLRQ